MNDASNAPKLSERDFVLRSIVALRKPGKLGMHTVWSYFNDSFRDEFGRDPYETITWLEKEGLIKKVFSRKGSWLYLKQDWEAEQKNKVDYAKQRRVKEALKKIYKNGEDKND